MALRKRGRNVYMFAFTIALIGCAEDAVTPKNDLQRDAQLKWTIIDWSVRKPEMEEKALFDHPFEYILTLSVEMSNEGDRTAVNINPEIDIWIGGKAIYTEPMQQIFEHDLIYPKSLKGGSRAKAILKYGFTLRGDVLEKVIHKDPLNNKPDILKIEFGFEYGSE